MRGLKTGVTPAATSWRRVGACRIASTSWRKAAFSFSAAERLSPFAPGSAERTFQYLRNASATSSFRTQWPTFVCPAIPPSETFVDPVQTAVGFAFPSLPRRKTMNLLWAIALVRASRRMTFSLGSFAALMVRRFSSLGKLSWNPSWSVRPFTLASTMMRTSAPRSSAAFSASRTGR